MSHDDDDMTEVYTNNQFNHTLSHTKLENYHATIMPLSCHYHGNLLNFYVGNDFGRSSSSSSSENNNDYNQFNNKKGKGKKKSENFEVINKSAYNFSHIGGYEIHDN